MMNSDGCCCHCESCCGGVDFNWDVTISLVDRPKNETGLPTGNNCDHCATDLSGTFSMSQRGGVYGRAGACAKYYRVSYAGAPIYCADDAYCYASGVDYPGSNADPTNDDVPWDVNGYWQPDGSLCSFIQSQVVETVVYCSSATEYTIEVWATVVFYLQMEDQTYNSHITNCLDSHHVSQAVTAGLVGFVNTFKYKRTIAIASFNCASVVNFDVPYDSKVCKCLDMVPASPEYYLCDPGPGAVATINSV